MYLVVYPNIFVSLTLNYNLQSGLLARQLSFSKDNLQILTYAGKIAQFLQNAWVK